MSRTAIGIDLGGTKLEAVAGVLHDDAIEVRARRRVPTNADRGYDAILAAVAELAQSIGAETGLDVATVPIGVGMPGNVTAHGLIKNSNTVCLNGRPFHEDLARAMARRLGFENDANCFALAEARFGAGRAQKDGMVFGVILGTGVGGGLVFKGSVWSGLQGIAGEWGHHAVWPGRGDRCYCGKVGCVERFVSGPAVESDYAKRAGVRRPLAEIAARRADDEHAAAAIELFLESFGRGLANVIDVLDPSAIVLGGGVSNLAFLYDEGAERVARYVFNEELVTPILKNELGDSAGVFGAALIAQASD